MSNAGQGLSAIAGGVIGFFVAGPAGAFAGFQYGLLAGSLLFPTQLPGVTGPRLEDYERAEADPGAAVWKTFGVVAVPGFRMYLGPVTEIEHTEEVGGKGAPTQDVTTFTYTQTLALGLCEGEIPGITRIWENGKIVYDLRRQQLDETDDAYDERIAASTVYGDTFTLYTGSEDQLPDPTLEAEKGVGNVPGFRGTAYIVFPDRLLQDDQARRHPVFKIEIGGDVATTLCAIRNSGTQRAATSDDGGLTWTMRTTPLVGGVTEGDWRAIAFSSSLRRLCVVGNLVQQTGEFIDTMVSDDGGLTWTGHDSGIRGGASDAWFSMIWVPDGGGFFLAGNYRQGGGSTALATFRKSATGLPGSWSAITLPGTIGPDVGVADICYSNDLQRIVAVVALGTGGLDCDIIYSDDWGATWTLASSFIDVGPMGFGSHVTGVDFDSQRGVFVYAGVQSSSFGPQNLATSPTGATWSTPSTPSTFPNNSDTLRVRYMAAHNLTVITALDRVADFTTNIGATQQPQAGHSWFGVAYDASRQRAMMIGSGTGADSFAYRDVGESTWTLVAMPQDGGWNDVTACVSGDSGEGVTIAEIVERICADLGVTDIDVSELADRTVVGYAITNVMNGISAINPLRMVGLFDYVESGETLRFPVRGAAAVATLTDEDLGPAFAQDSKPPKIATRKLQDVELPLQIRLKYLSQARDYEKGEQLSPARLGTVGLNLVDVDCAVVLEDDDAAQLAEILFREAWASRYSHTFQLDASFHALEPADCLIVPIDERNYRVRILKVAETGLILRKFEATRDDDGSYTSTAVATPPSRPPSVLELLGITEVTLLDLPALQDTADDPGFYFTVRNVGPGSAWDGAFLHKSIDGGSNYTVVAAVNQEAFVGEIVSHPIAADTYTWDNESEVVIDMLEGTLQSRTDAAVLNGANALAIGAHGRWHILQFANAELVDVGRYRLTRLLFGRRGTEHLIESVVAGDVAVLVSGSGIYRHVLQEAEIGAERVYRPVTVGAPFSTGTDVDFTGQGQALECFSPVYVHGERDPSNNLTITWLRRDRLSQTLRDGVPVPLNEASEAYEVDVLDGVDVVRTISSSVETLTYTAAQQTTDFGSPQPSIEVRIYQLSATVGRGIPAEATL